MEEEEKVAESSAGGVCRIMPVRESLYYRTKRRAAEEVASRKEGEGEEGRRSQKKFIPGDSKLRCAVCPGRGRLYCVDCSTESDKDTKGYVGLCAPSTGRPCLHTHMNAMATK